MDDDYDSYYGIAVKTWFGPKGNEKNSRYVNVCGWHYGRWIIERDGLISFQVTVHSQEHHCYSCKDRIGFVKQQLADQNVQCFWTCEPDDGSLYVTVGPPPPGTSAEMYLSCVLGLPVQMYSSSTQRARKQRKKKAGSRKRRHILQ
jgi:hypothetical protein